MALLPNQAFKQGMFSAGHFTPAIPVTNGPGGITGQQYAINFFSGTMPSSMAAFWALLSSTNASSDLRACPTWVGTLGGQNNTGLIRLNGSSLPTIASTNVPNYTPSGTLSAGNYVRNVDGRFGGNITYALVMHASPTQANNSGCFCTGDGVCSTSVSQSFQTVANTYPALLLSVGATGTNHPITLDTPNTTVSANAAACSVGTFKLYFSLV